MRQDHRGFYSHEEDDVKTSTSARLTRPKTYTSAYEIEHIIDDPHSQEKTMLIDEYRRRNYRLPNTQDDPQQDTARAYALPRAKMIPAPAHTPAKKRLTRRSALYALGAATVAALIGGAYIKSEVDSINSRMEKGAYDFTAGRYTDIIGSSSQTTELYAFLQPDYRVRFVQVSSSDASKSKVIVTQQALMNQPIDTLTLSIDVQERDGHIVCSIVMQGQSSASWSFVYDTHTGFFA